jgi:hypothetical protein
MTEVDDVNQLEIIIRDFTKGVSRTMYRDDCSSTDYTTTRQTRPIAKPARHVTPFVFNPQQSIGYAGRAMAATRSQAMNSHCPPVRGR